MIGNLFHEKSNEELTKLYKQYKQFCVDGKYSDNELYDIRKMYPEFSSGFATMALHLTTEIADRWLEKFDFSEMKL